MSILVSNNAYSTLASSILAVDTTLTVASGGGSLFPAASTTTGTYFYATLINTSNQLEIVKVTNRSTDTLTIVRAQDGTTARTYSSGDRIELRPVAALFQEIIQSTPAGSLMPYAGSSAPTGWLLCYGQPVSRTTYAALFTALGTTYGVGDGSTTFNLPDLRGRVIAGKDDMGGTSANRLTDLTDGLDGDVLGDAGGTESNTLDRSALPNITLTTDSQGAHRHYMFRNDINGADITGDADYFVSWEKTTDESQRYNLEGGTTPDATLGRTSESGNHTHTTESINGDVTQTVVNNVQPTLILNYIIKT